MEHSSHAGKLCRVKPGVTHTPRLAWVWILQYRTGRSRSTLENTMEHVGSRSELVEVPDKISILPTSKPRRPCITFRAWTVLKTTSNCFERLAAEDTVARHIGDHGLYDLTGSGVPAYPGTFGSRQTGQLIPRSTRAMVSSAASILPSRLHNYLSRLSPAILLSCYQEVPVHRLLKHCWKWRAGC
jgi:hypothetical protein